MLIPSPDNPQNKILEASVCIVGAGAAGISLACELDGCGLSVVVLEAGGLQSNPQLSDNYRGTATAPHPDPTQFRRAAFGGTTSLWGGRCVAFDPIDFERRDYVAGSGWPISYEEVAKYYPRAMDYCDAGDFDFTVSGSVPRASPTIAGFDGNGDLLDDRIERYSLPTDFGKRYRRRLELSSNVTVLLNSRCVRLNKRSGDDTIESAQFVDTSGRRGCVKARVFVLAAGGIEVPRLMMDSDPLGSGLGNREDCLGRYYSCHFENVLGRLTPNGAAIVFGFEKTSDGVYCRRQLRLSAAAQRRDHLLSTAFRLHFPNYSDATHGSSVMSAIYLAKSALVPEYRAILQHSAGAQSAPALPHLRNVLAGMPKLAKFTAEWLFQIKLARRKLPYTLVANADGSYPVDFNCEQTPDPANRISLTHETDHDGLRRVNIAWRVSEADAEAAARAFLLLRDTLRRSSTCRFEFDENALRERLRRSPPLGGHHIGTARMAATPRSGVVDSNCAVFGLPNLFIASSAVFTTGSHANPTLTIVALAARLAGHLKATLS
jgi:choline dehydrogenase-like flavoprotein